MWVCGCVGGECAELCRCGWLCVDVRNISVGVYACAFYCEERKFLSAIFLANWASSQPHAVAALISELYRECNTAYSLQSHPVAVRA